MTFWHSLCDATQSIRANTLRSFLTMLGIIIGVSALITMLSVGAGAQMRVAEQIASLGTNVLMMLPGAERNATGPGGKRVRPVRLTVEDARAIGTTVPQLITAAPSLQGQARLIRGNRNWLTKINGTTADYFFIRDWPLIAGRHFSRQEEIGAGKVVVIGQSVQERLFGKTDPIGREVRVLNAPMKVIGVLARKGPSGSGRDQDDIAFVPLKTAQLRLGSSDKGISHRAVSYILAKAAQDDLIAAAKAGVENLLRQRHHVPDGNPAGFRVADPAAAMAAQRGSTRTIGWLLAAIASISLIVGGISIMNIMLVSGDGTHARDWVAAYPGCESARHQSIVHDRGFADLHHWRAARRDFGCSRRMVDRATHRLADPGRPGNCIRRSRIRGRNSARLWLLPGSQSGKNASGNGVTKRMNRGKSQCNFSDHRKPRSICRTGAARLKSASASASIFTLFSADRAVPNGLDGNVNSKLKGLIDRMAAGDRSALKRLFAETSPRLMGLCMLILDDRAQAQSALSDAFVAIWRNAADFDTNRGNAFDWLASVTRREAIRRRDASPEKNTVGRTIEPQLAVQAIARLPEGSTLKRRLQNVTTDSAQALVMSYIYGLTYAQLADALKVEPSAAGHLVAQALTALRD